MSSRQPCHCTGGALFITGQRRVPVKLTVSVPPDLHRRLQDYASAYAQTYGQDEPISELIPAMLMAFLDADRGFSKARSTRGKGGPGDG